MTLAGSATYWSARMATVENHLIELLPRKDRLRLLEQCESVEMKLGDVVCEPGVPTRYVYFPTDGFISFVAMRDGKPGLEVGMVGREGMLGEQLVLGEMVTPFHAVVQGPGVAWRIDAGNFRKELTHSVALQRILRRYLYVRMLQLANLAVCVRFHQIGPRLARWLLMSQDRAHADSFHMTHEIMAYMLGVRRVGITTAAGTLQRDGLIEYHHGYLSVQDRPGLQAAACSCYAKDTEAYERQLGDVVAAEIRR